MSLFKSLKMLTQLADRLAMKKPILLLSAILILSGCATQQKFKDQVESWKGVKAQQLVRTMGIPDRSMDVPGGGKAYEYMTNQRTVAVANNFTHTAQAVDQYCKVTYFANADEVITDVSYEGNRCRSR